MVPVYIDGFNLFHAIKDLEDDGLKWVNLWRLSEQLVRGNESVTIVKYFPPMPNGAILPIADINATSTIWKM